MTSSNHPGIRPSRRAFIVGGMASFAAAGIVCSNRALAQGAGPSRFAYVGCRTSKERNARGEGIGVYRMDAGTGDWKPIQLLKDIPNPSFLAFDRTESFLYAVHGDLGEVSAFRIAPKTGEIAFINKQDCGGKNPVHLTPDLTNKFMLVANYATGTLGALPINADGSLGALSDIAKVPGEPGPHKSQQKGIHPHQIPYASGNRFLIVPDKGGDKVSVFRFDPASGKFAANDPASIAAREGAGPRHMAFHPALPIAYLVNELDSTIGTYAWDGEKGTLKGLQLLPATPADFMGNNTSAGIAIAPSGKFVYLSNRGHDSITTYAVDPASGLLRAISWTSTQGKQPRFFTLDPTGSFLYAANENSDSIVTFKVNAATGELTSTGQVISTGSPTCVVFSRMQ